MTFSVKVLHVDKWLTFPVERIFADERTERYRVSGKDRSIVLETNRPSAGLRAPKWELVEGDMKNAVILTSLCFMIEEHVNK